MLFRATINVEAQVPAGPDTPSQQEFIDCLAQVMENSTAREAIADGLAGHSPEPFEFARWYLRAEAARRFPQPDEPGERPPFPMPELPEVTYRWLSGCDGFNLIRHVDGEARERVGTHSGYLNTGATVSTLTWATIFNAAPALLKVCKEIYDAVCQGEASLKSNQQVRELAEAITEADWRTAT